MRLVLMWLSVLAAWGLLGVLAVGLLLTFKSAQSIRGWFQKITVGLRAIEQQAASLEPNAAALTASIREAAAAIDSAALRLAETDRHLGAAAPRLRLRSWTEGGTNAGPDAQHPDQGPRR